jgi:hypothetical protein
MLPVLGDCETVEAGSGMVVEDAETVVVKVFSNTRGSTVYNSQGYFILNRALIVSRPKEHSRARLSHILKVTGTIRIESEITS